MKDPENMANLLKDSTEQDGSPFQNFQKNIKKSLSSHIDTELNSKIAENKEFAQTMLSHHLSQQKAKNELFTAFSTGNPQTD